ncbi:MAG TPA: acetyltransferase [Solibacterales bacterium]|nr:acetyltransferase [Bryobacterales bacterium]
MVGAHANLNAAAYLARIGYHGSLAPTPETLRLLHRAHMQTVPFENLDISRSRPIVIDVDAFVRKVVEQRRGGFCYELNGAFAALLRAMGFPVALLSARFRRDDGSDGPEFDHLALRVDCGEPWLADVGFGDGFLEPLVLKTAVEQEGFLIMEQAGGSLQVQRRQPDASWKIEYLVAPAPRQLTDFANRCHYHQTSPESHFTQKRICSRATTTGRITLSDLRLIITESERKEERMLGSEEQWHAALEQHFGIVLR